MWRERVAGGSGSVRGVHVVDVMSGQPNLARAQNHPNHKPPSTGQEPPAASTCQTQKPIVSALLGRIIRCNPT